MTVGEGFELTAQPDSTARSLWRAEAWRLWRMWRWLVVGAWVFMLAGTALAALPALVGSGPHAAKIVQGVLYPLLYRISLQSSSPQLHPPVTVSGLPSISQGAGFVALVFAALLVSLDRSRGGMLFALSGPVQRWHVWSVQSAFALLVPLSALTLKALCLFTLDASTGFAIPAHVPLLWWAVNGLFDIVVAATAIFVVAAVGQVLLAIIASVLLLVLPMLTGGVLAGLAGAPDPSSISLNSPPSAAGVAFLAAHPLLQVAKVFVALAPVAHLGGNQGISWASSPSGGPPTPLIHLDTAVHIGPGLVVWLVAWALGLLWLSWLVTRTSKAEMWREPMIRPRFALFVMWEFAAVLAYLIAQPLRMTVGVPFQPVFPVAFLLFGGLAQWLYRRVF